MRRGTGLLVRDRNDARDHVLETGLRGGRCRATETGSSANTRAAVSSPPEAERQPPDQAFSALPVVCRACWSLLHPWIVRRVGVHGRAPVIDGFGAQFVVPGFVAVDLAQPVLGAVLGQPRRGIEGPNVDRVPRHVSRRFRGGHPAGGFLFGSVLGNRLTKKLILVLRGTPATIDEELDPVVRGISCSLAQGTEESWIKLGYTRNLVIKGRRAVGDGTVGLTKRTTVLTAKTTVLTAKDVDGRGRRGRGRRQLVAEGCGDRRGNDQQAGDTDPANPNPTGRCSCWLAVGHAPQSRQRGVASTYAIFDTPTICASS
jgi:hypothetical protein